MTESRWPNKDDRIEKTVNITWEDCKRYLRIAKHNRLRLGFNTISNRLWYLNDKIQLDWLNLSFETFKIKMKELFITETWGNGMPNNIVNSIY